MVLYGAVDLSRQIGKVTNVAFVYKALSMYVGANPMLFVEIVKYA